MKAEYSSGTAHLSYWILGTGIPVIFLHPTPLDHDYWRPLIERLSGIQAIVPDLRGHGASELGTDLPKGAFSLAPDAPVHIVRRVACSNHRGDPSFPALHAPPGASCRRARHRLPRRLRRRRGPCHLEDRCRRFAAVHTTRNNPSSESGSPHRRVRSSPTARAPPHTGCRVPRPT